MTEDRYVLTVPLDLSDIAEKNDDDRLKVVTQTADDTITSTVVTVGELDRAAGAQLPQPPGDGPGRARSGGGRRRQVLDGDTVRTVVPARMWDDITKINLAPIKIGPWYWGWWKRWCRTITVEGRLVCPDGRPVPGAQVCAYDIDWWFIWSSKQQVGCTTTAADGTFTLTFTWCCGLYPWWWWFQTRPWILDDDLSDLVRRRLDSDLRVPFRAPTAQPSLSVFEAILAKHDGMVGERGVPLAELDPEKVDAARKVLLDNLPSAPELEKLQIWPWAPWTPWRDCAPDLVFRAVQDCGEGRVVVLDEGPASTRWDVPDSLQVTLVANDQACCRPDDGKDD